MERPGAKFREPTAHDVRSHLRAVVRANVLRHTLGEHHVGHSVINTKLLIRATRIASHQTMLSPVVGLIFDKVVAPDVIAIH